MAKEARKTVAGVHPVVVDRLVADVEVVVRAKSQRKANPRTSTR